MIEQEATDRIDYSMASAIYHRVKAVSQSALKSGLRSMAHMRHYLDHPSEPTDVMNLGTLVHSGVLEEKTVAYRYAVEPGSLIDGIDAKVPKATKAYKERYAEWAATVTGREIVTQDQYDSMAGMVSSLLDNPIANALFGRGGGREAAMFWTCPDTGLRCKGLVDCMVDDKAPTIADLKTTRDASSDEFVRSIVRYGYHIQAWWYLRGRKILTGNGDANFVVVAVENTPPYGTNVFEIGGKWLKIGAVDGMRVLREYAKCVETGIWPSYPAQILEPEVPTWLSQRYPIAEEE